MPTKLLTLVMCCSLLTCAVCAQPLTENSFPYRTNEPVVERVATIANQLLDVPYADGPLGEGSNGAYDADPLYRFDLFDCTTFVETVVALALAENPKEFEQNLNRIRYQDGQIGFVTRNHFPSADWIPNNIKAGFFTDITAQIAGADVQEAQAEIDKQGWYAKMDEGRIQGFTNLSADEKKAKLAKLQAEGQQFKPMRATLPYLALATLFPAQPVSDAELAKRTAAEKAITDEYAKKLAEATTEDRKKEIEKEQKKNLNALRLANRIADAQVQTAILAKIPSGVVVSLVRPNWNLQALIGTNMNVSHQGLIIRKDAQLYMVHASSTAQKVVAEPLIEYLQQYLLSETLKGINILQVNAP
jgi:hypothetical protein